jgi:hypothetical protein
MVLSGDSPHYLVMLRSLLDDRDLDLRNNYDRVLAGEWDAGVRFAGKDLHRHVDRDARGREISFHSPFLPLVLALPCLPLRGTGLEEPLAIWLTMLAGFGAVAWFHLGAGLPSSWTLLLALVTPLWCYSRGLWTEPWLAFCWAGLLFSPRLPVRAALGFLGTLFKAPFAVVPLAAGLWSLWRGRRGEGWVLTASGLAGLVLAAGTAQWLFRDTGHTDLFHLGSHPQVSTGFLEGLAWRYNLLPLAGAAGLLLHPAKGLLPFFPHLATGFRHLLAAGPWRWSAAAFFLVHAWFVDWPGGTGFSARYLVPMLPLLVLAAGKGGGGGRAHRILVLASLPWALLSGIYPSLVYDRTLWEVLRHLAEHLRPSW